MAPVHAQKPAGPAKVHALDELIMGTNSSSIVSKRSVEKLYYPDEPHYFRYFVKKFQRRAPLINRGYWLRLRAIDVVVKQFLSNHPTNKKVIINLGCGSDVLPWQSHVRYASLCDDVLFVDIDYPDLMLKKRSIVLETPQLRDILGQDFLVSDQDQILLRSDRYCQIGCDLRELTKLRASLETLIPLAGCPVLFIAEVSITYMDTKSADALIQWASTIGKSEFCLLEQLLPCGPDHPFAATMLSHFEKLKTPPKPVRQYRTLADQSNRFRDRGYAKVSIWDLWEAWSSEKFVSSSERAALDEIEPFDEWEEFALFGRHYFVIHAFASGQSDPRLSPTRASLKDVTETTNQFRISVTKYDGPAPKRRFGDALAMTDPKGGISAVHFMGVGTAGRAESCDIYSLDGQTKEMPLVPITGPVPRMCHSLTDLGDYGVLLVGGRTSPANVLSDCWIFSRGQSSQWRPTSSLPIPLFRHSIIRLRGSSLALVVGGKTGPSTISENCYVYHAIKGWLKCTIIGDAPEPVFGAVLCNSPACLTSDGLFTGILAGGIGPCGRISSKKYIWELNGDNPQPTIKFSWCGKEFDPFGHLSIFGARTVDFESHAVICGGVGTNAESQGQGIIVVDMPTEDIYTVSNLSPRADDYTMPFMIGSSIMRAKDSIVTLGGGATCFSMGTFWETGVFRINITNKPGHWKSSESEKQILPKIQFLGSQRVVSISGQGVRQVTDVAKAVVTTIPRVRLESPEHFNDILKTGLPVIIENANFGDCVRKWTPSYMINRVGYDTEVVVHECSTDTEKMDFNSKNFRYITEKFGKVMERSVAGERVYLRALSQNKPSERPANISNDFPELAQDFSLPKEMEYVNRCLFSSVLRVAGRTNMWLHYDVMANVYAQVRGSKRMILFPPHDVKHLVFAPGASSSSLDVFSELDSPRLAATSPYEAALESGDILFIPPCWLHTAAAVSDCSVAVNVFFRDLDNGYAVGRDVYGNRDLAPYEKGRVDIARIGKSFRQLPLETRRFYLQRLADELELAAEGL